MSNEKKVRYNLEVGECKGFLAPLTFPVVEVALGLVLSPKPKYLEAGAVIINTLWIRGSKELREGGKHWDRACMQAYAAIEAIEYVFKDDEITIFLEDKKYSCKLKPSIPRETLEEALGYMKPVGSTPRFMTAGKKVLFDCWVSGDEEIKTNPELLVIACTAAYRLLNFEKASLKKV